MSKALPENWGFPTFSSGLLDFLLWYLPLVPPLYLVFRLAPAPGLLCNSVEIPVVLDPFWRNAVLSKLQSSLQFMFSASGKTLQIFKS